VSVTESGQRQKKLAQHNARLLFVVQHIVDRINVTAAAADWSNLSVTGLDEEKWSQHSALTLRAVVITGQLTVHYLTP